MYFSFKYIYIRTFEAYRLCVLLSAFPVIRTLAICYGLSVKCLPTGSCVGHLVPSWWGYFGGVSGNVKRWTLVGGGKLWGKEACFLTLFLILTLSSLTVFFHLLQNEQPCHTLSLLKLHHRPSEKDPSDHEWNILKL